MQDWRNTEQELSTAFSVNRYTGDVWAQQIYNAENWAVGDSPFSVIIEGPKLMISKAEK